MLTNYVPDPLANGPLFIMAGSGASIAKVPDSVIAPRAYSYRVRTEGNVGVMRLPSFWHATTVPGTAWAASALIRIDPEDELLQDVTLALEFYNNSGVRIATTSVRFGAELPDGFYETSPGSGLFIPSGATMSADRSYSADLFMQITDDMYELTKSGVASVPAPQTVQVFGVAPAGTTSVNMSLSGVAFNATQLMLVQASEETMPAFFTGDSGPFYAWTGTEGATPSLYYQTYPQLTPKDDRVPVERVELVFREVLPGAQYVNVWRVADGRTTEVRGGLRKYAVGGFPLVDYEAPFGVPITYRAEMFTDSTMTVSLGFTESASTTLDVKTACIHQPLNPSAAVWPLTLIGTATEVTRRTPGELVYAEGAETGTWLGQQRRGVQGVPFDMLTETLADADRFQAILGRYGESTVSVVCIRTPPPMRIPRTFFGTIEELTETSVDVANGGGMVRFTFTSDEVRPPAPGLVPALLRRMDMDAAYTTRAEFDAAYLTRLDADRDFSLAGLAG